MIRTESHVVKPPRDGDVAQADMTLPRGTEFLGVMAVPHASVPDYYLPMMSIRVNTEWPDFVYPVWTVVDRTEMVVDGLDEATYLGSYVLNGVILHVFHGDGQPRT